MKAKVFLSCGQFKGSDEPRIAEAIAKRIRDLGFDCYFAIADQSLRGLRENIFGELESSEYFVFVDFKREKITCTDAETLHRGSLFSHQELGVASYLNIPCLVFQEEGVKERDGMLSCLQANAHPFTDRALLPDLIAKRIQDKTSRDEWSSKWKNALSLHRPDKPFSDAHNTKHNVVYRYFHIEVKNHHRVKVAQNCYAVLEAITNVEDGMPVPMQTVEFKWSGTKLPNVFVAANSYRRFDAFRVRRDKPADILFYTYGDSTEFVPSVPDFGTYFLTYGVYSSNFPTARATFRLSHHGDLPRLCLDEV